VKALVRSCLALLPVGLLGCGTSFDSIGQLDGVRVLGVEKSNPLAAPGEQIELRMLAHDTGPIGGKSSKPRPAIQTAWLSGCVNPPADLYQGCFLQFGQVLAQLGIDPENAIGGNDGAANAELLAQLAKVGIGLGFGETFRYAVPSDIISRKPPPTAPGASPYGLSYVFFAACAGTLVPDVDAGEFPIRCIDDDGKPVGARDFVAGYTSIYSYLDNTNRNPKLLGFEAGGKAQKAANTCIAEACEALAWDASRKCDGSEPKVAACGDESMPGNCPTLKFKAKVDPKSVDDDPILSRDNGVDATEQMWVNYHTDRGQFMSDLSLVNDPSVGFINDAEGEFVAPEAKGKAHVWTVVRDNRGGTTWGRFDICVQ
jgi:hypothetical protein